MTPTPLHGPAFGSYAADDVTWLLKDLSHAELEAPVEEREAAIQAGTAHYAESLPVEYQPSPEYTGLFEKALAEQARRVALAAGVLVHLVVDLRGSDAALVSLARAGTPIGILLRRYARRLGLDLPHYTMSIVRGRGLDQVALRHLAERHAPGDVVFVDGWTGKGAISRELTAACADLAQRTGQRFDPSLAVLADPANSTDVYGTRDDFLIPSACLNSTVSGLVSRTVLNDRLIGPDDFHGAKFYADLAPGDVSRRYVDEVEAHFDDVADEARAEATRLLGTDRTPSWSGWRAVEEVSAAYGIGDVNLVKPGVGETTRVLLRRVPWRVLVRPDRRDELGHVELLAEQRGVPVEVVEDLAFSCMGLIHPRFAQSES
ncbi:cysteine protease StiP family protein [Nocardioides dongxiaopingii]|uniref:cysteine protease StiP family protein n=1 Tax=Nocardioides sp. S-1144 TaxID=2582905 RepID=UPI001C9E9F4C|nr:cysteine protease StiP family protein [Nocardioides sp. S-1144]